MLRQYQQGLALMVNPSTVLGSPIAMECVSTLWIGGQRGFLPSASKWQLTRSATGL
ncbi:Uncharacterised protein [Avibacterium paragallinarum]|uniref:Uncharacterized protein n=1 Tax=Avibacterium paragallinarum TaxID=728 RepID=A0A380X3W5_AVIPA|nr:Uncharacterised protein [Avibacterium paragallinarum]